MKAKILLTGLVAPLMFAACTSEEIVPQQEAGKVDLSNRPTLGKVTLNFGAQTRATLDKDVNFSQILFEQGVDGFGARIIDAPTNGSNKVNPWFNYGIQTYASSNYKYVNAGGTSWETEALMVEGHYMFYTPYNENALYRDALKLVYPKNQKVNPASEEVSETGANLDAIKAFYEGESTAIVGYAFLSAANQDAVVSPTLQHIYAYPQITLVNKHTWNHDNNGETPNVGRAITIKKLEITAPGLYANGSINHQGLVDNLRSAIAKLERNDGRGNDAVPAGDWSQNNGKFIKEARTADIATFTAGNGEANTIVVEFEDGLTLDPNEAFKFHVVLPARDYAAGDIKIKPILVGDNNVDMQFAGNQGKFGNAAAIDYAPGKRYPEQEYNFNGSSYSVKATAGSLATYNLSGDQTPLVKVEEAIKDLTDFGAFLNTIKDNSSTLVEVASVEDIQNENQFALAQSNGWARLAVTPAMRDSLNIYLANGKVKFISKMNVSGDVNLDNKIEFDNDVNINGNLTINGASIDGNLTISGGNVEVKALSDVNATTITTSGKVTIHKDFTPAMGNITVKNGELLINRENYIDADSNVTVDRQTNDLNETTTTGTLTIGADNSAANVTLNYGKIIVNSGKTFSNADAMAWAAGTTIDNNGTISAAAATTVPANSTYNHKENAVFTGTLNNNGTINNNSILAVNTNNGTIKAEVMASRTTVTDGTGQINNDKLAYVSAPATNTVFYTFTSAVGNAEIEAFDAKKYNINKLIFTKAVTFNKQFTNAKTMDGVKTIDFNSGSSLYMDALVGTSVTNININANVKFSGYSKTHGGLGFKYDTNIHVAGNCTLTLQNVSVGSAYADADVTFTYGSTEVNNNLVDGKIVVDGADFYVGTNGTNNDHITTTNGGEVIKNYYQ